MTHYHAVMDRSPLTVDDRQSVPLTPHASTTTTREEARAVIHEWRHYRAAHGWTVTGNDDDTLAADPVTFTYQGAAVETCWKDHR
jgi:hypothetical protein